MIFLIYTSSAVTPFSPSELVDLLATSHRNNASLGVTGMLLYKDGNVMQLLEGEEAVVQTLYNKIERDPRHRGLLTLLRGAQPERQFPDWSMGFRDLTSSEAHTTPGYTEFLNTPLDSQAFSADPTRGQKLLTMFKKNM